MTPHELLDKALLSDDPETVARWYATATEMRDQWRSTVRDIEAHLHAVMEGHAVKRVEIPGVGVCEASRKVKRTGWRTDDLLGDIARAVPTQRRLTAEGELEPVEWVMARLVGECLSISGGKVTGIRRHLPHDPDEYCTEGDAEPVVRLSLFDRTPS